MNDRFSVHAIGDQAIGVVQRMRQQFQTELCVNLIGQEDLAAGRPDFAIVVDWENGQTLQLAMGAHADSDMFRLYIVDDAMDGALEEATGAIAAARACGNYFSAAMCLRPMEDPEIRLHELGYAALQCVVDSLIIVPPRAAQPVEDVILRAALALVRMAVPHMASMMCVDVADIKHLLAGVVAALVSDGEHSSSTQFAVEDLGRLARWNDMPRAAFCAYSAPAALLDLATAETVIADRISRLEVCYPDAVIEVALVPLAAAPMTGNTELVTWITFPQSEEIRCTAMASNGSLREVADIMG